MGRNRCMSSLTSMMAAAWSFGFGVREGRFELLLPVAVGRKGDSLARLAPGLQLDHVAGQIEHRVGHAFLLLGPRRAPQLGELRGRFARPDVLLHEINQRNRHEHAHRVGEFEDQVLFFLVAFVEQFHPSIDADAVRQMNDQVSLAQLEKGVDRPRFVGAATRLAADFRPPEQLLIAEDDQSFRDQSKTMRHVPDAQLDATFERAAGLRQQLGQPRRARHRCDRRSAPARRVRRPIPALQAPRSGGR